MSIVVAIKYEGGVVIGCDKQTTTGNIKWDDSTKIMKSRYSNTALGVVGTAVNRDILFHNIKDLMRYEDILEGVKIDRDYVIDMSMRFRDILVQNHAVEIVNNYIEYVEGDFIVVSDERIFKISGYGSVHERENWVAVGSGAELVSGYLDTVKFQNITKSKAEELVKQCILKCCKNDVFINDHIDMIFLDRKEIDNEE